MPTLRESLKAEIDSLEQKLASKKAAFEGVGNVLDMEVSAVGDVIRRIASHIFPAKPVASTTVPAAPAVSVVATVAIDHTPEPEAPSIVDRIAEFLTPAKPSPAQLP